MQTGFPLTGSHTATNCTSCHIDLKFGEPEAAPDDCSTCHVDVHQGSFGQNCVDCHNTSLFQDIEGIALHAQTSFPLAGTHAQLNCISCHTDDANGAFTPLETGCISCHEEDYENALSVDHVAAGFPTQCETCHNDLQWQGTLFEHVLASNGFELIGAHDQIACASCHRSPDLTPIFETTNDQNCISCHQNDYDDEHAGSGFPTACLDCHNQNTWDDAIFDHIAASEGFALLGAHEQLSCASCHNLPDLTLLYQPPPTSDQECITCHQNDYDDEHAGSGFPTTCLDCHTLNTWDDANFDHITSSGGFGLLGAHEALQCTSCHTTPDLALLFSPVPTNDQECIACHQSDYDDEHAGSGFPTTCIDCHNTNNWDDADFDHITASEGFELLGAHDALQCTSCHSMQDLALLYQPPPANDQECIACHQSDYDDNHAGSGFPATCIDCHNTNNWDDADFNHLTASNGFDLLGAHDALQCASCHNLPDLTLLYEPPPANDQECIACHQSDYDDEHAGSGFPTTCIDCHNTNNWDADFDHDAQYFPIYTGKHKEAWTTCQSCHIQPNTFAIFSCEGACHEHRQPEMDDKHSEVNDYAFEPTLCLSCHPTGN